MQILQGKTVLVVDDSSEQREAVAALYQELGCKVVGQAEDGLETLSKVKELSPDIVSLDIIMPNMDGIECYKNISENHPEVKVLFLSCLAKNFEVRDALVKKIDASILLPKPCERDVLEKAVLALYNVTQTEEVEEKKGDDSDINLSEESSEVEKEK